MSVKSITLSTPGFLPSKLIVVSKLLDLSGLEIWWCFPLHIRMHVAPKTSCARTYTRRMVKQ